MKGLILKALNEKGFFIGYYMLCRYLNNKGYVRFGCNAGYNGKFKPKSNPKNRISPCKFLCPNSKIYYSKVRYYCIQLEKQEKLFLKKTLFKDSDNPDSIIKPHKFDIFVIIAKSKEILNHVLSGKIMLVN